MSGNKNMVLKLECCGHKVDVMDRCRDHVVQWGRGAFSEFGGWGCQCRCGGLSGDLGLASHCRCGQWTW